MSTLTTSLVDLKPIPPTSSPLPPPPHFKFGLLTDIQHAPIPDGASYSGIPRYYQHALHSASIAATAFESDNVDFSLNLGDIIDGNCQYDAAKKNAVPRLDEGGIMCTTTGIIGDVLDGLKKYTGRWVHVYGNHCLYNFNRKRLCSLLNIGHVIEDDEIVAYSSFTPHAGYKFLFVDSYDIAILGRSGSKKAAAEIILSTKNPNYVINSGMNGRGNSPEGLEGLDRRFVLFNGSFGDTQLAWIRKELEESREKGEKVFICGHQPFHPESANEMCLSWNYDLVLELIGEFKGTVVATLSGHTHTAGHHQDGNGVHHIVINAILETVPPDVSYGIVEVGEDGFDIKGSGNVESRGFKF